MSRGQAQVSLKLLTIVTFLDIPTAGRGLLRQGVWAREELQWK